MQFNAVNIKSLAKHFHPKNFQSCFKIHDGIIGTKNQSPTSQNLQTNRVIYTVKETTFKAIEIAVR